MENQLLFVLILWLLVMYFVESTKQKLWKKTKKELKGVPINELSDNMIYHQCPSPGALVFLFEGDEIEPKV